MLNHSDFTVFFEDISPHISSETNPAAWPGQSAGWLSGLALWPESGVMARWCVCVCGFPFFMQRILNNLYLYNIYIYIYLC